MKKTYGLVMFVLLFIGVTILTGCGAADDSREETPPTDNGNKSTHSEPVIVDNANRSLTFERAPKRTVTLMQQDAELMLALGLEDALIGYALVSDGTPDAYQNLLANIPILAKNSPSKEVLLDADPDFVIGSEVDFTDNGVGTIEELDNLDITTYVTKLASPETLESHVYDEIADLARIFDVAERGEALIASMQAEIDEIVAQVGEVDKPLKVFYMNGGEAGSAQTTGGDSLQSSLIELAGGENIFSDLEGYRVEVSWEEVIARDPDVIILSYCCGSGPDVQKDMITNNEALADITAVKNEHYIAAEVENLVGTVRIPSGLETLARGFYPERFE